MLPNHPVKEQSKCSEKVNSLIFCVWFFVILCKCSLHSQGMRGPGIVTIQKKLNQRQSEHPEQINILHFLLNLSALFAFISDCISESQVP